MEEAPEMAVSDPNSGLPAFLALFDSLEFNSLPTSHFHRFGPPFGSFLRFSVPVCHSWRGYSKPIRTSLVGSGEAYSRATS